MPIPLNEPPIHPTASAMKGTFFFGYSISWDIPQVFIITWVANTYHCRRHNPILRSPGSPAHSAIYTQEKANKSESRQHNDAASHTGRMVTGDGHSSSRRRNRSMAVWLSEYMMDQKSNTGGESEDWEQSQLKPKKHERLVRSVGPRHEHTIISFLDGINGPRLVTHRPTWNYTWWTSFADTDRLQNRPGGGRRRPDRAPPAECLKQELIRAPLANNVAMAWCCSLEISWIAEWS